MPTKYSNDQKREAIRMCAEQGATAAAAYIGCTKQSVSLWSKDLKLQQRLGMMTEKDVKAVAKTERTGVKLMAKEMVAKDINARAKQIRSAAIQRRETVGESIDVTLKRVAELLESNKRPVFDKEGRHVGDVPLTGEDIRNFSASMKLLVDVSRTISGEELAEKLALIVAKSDVRAAKEKFENLDISSVIDAVSVETSEPER